METEFDTHIAAVRGFNRFYTRQIGVLREGLVDSPYSLAEARVLYELAHRERPTAGEIGRDLGLDAGYLSRILRGFVRRGLVRREPSATDARQSHLLLTEAGRATFAGLDEGSRAAVAELLAPLAVAERRRLVAAMRTAEAVLAPAAGDRATPYLLRPHRPGDMGWIVHRQAVLYTEEYGWNGEFEALLAEIAAAFIRNFDPAREQCWIAERDGEVVGSVLLVRHSDDVAKLRLLYVEPNARGLGIGRRLVEECIRFAARAGYCSIMLWTNDVLTAARRIYAETGFRLVQSEPHRSFGKDLVGETWELELRSEIR